MRRRVFIGILASMALPWPTQGHSYLPPASSLSQDLQELGYVESQNIEIVYRYAEGDNARMPALARQFREVRNIL